MVSSGGTRDNGHKLKYKKIYLGETPFDLRVIKHWNMGGCGDSVLGVTQNMTGHTSEQPAVSHLAPSRGVGLDGLQRSFPTLNSLGFYDFSYIIPLRQKNILMLCKSSQLVSASYLLQNSFITLLPDFSNLSFTYMLLPGSAKSTSCPTYISEVAIYCLDTLSLFYFQGSCISISRRLYGMWWFLKNMSFHMC